MASKKMWIEVNVIEGPTHSCRPFSEMPETYDITPVSLELRGRLTLSVKPQFLSSAMNRIGVPDRPSPGNTVNGSRVPIYEQIKEGDIQNDMDDVVSKLTGKKPSSFVTLIGELVDDILRPGK